MRTRTTRTRAMLAAAAAIAPATGWVLPAPVEAQEPEPGAPSEPVPSATAAIDGQADFYAREFDVDVAEARERMTQQQALVDSLGRLRQLAGDRLAGAWIEHRPDFRGVVRLTGPVADQAAFDAAVDASPVPIEVRTDAPMSLAQLKAEQARVGESLARSLPAASTGIDEPTGSVMVYVPAANQAQRRTSSTELAAIRALTDAPVRVTYEQGEVQTMSVMGGDRMNPCTSGFTVYDSWTGLNGLVTAGHCPPPITYDSYAGDRHRLTFQRSEVSAITDVAVFTSDHNVIPWFFCANDTSSLCAVQGFVGWSTQVEGTIVCQRGKTTGFSCGEITDVASTECDSADFCEPFWVRVDGDWLACGPGDSGAPVFSGNQAYGILHGGHNSGLNPGECSYMIYTPIDFKYTRLGASLLKT